MILQQQLTTAKNFSLGAEIQMVKLGIGNGVNQSSPNQVGSDDWDLVAPGYKYMLGIKVMEHFGLGDITITVNSD
jgi:hypothetical protein